MTEFKAMVSVFRTCYETVPEKTVPLKDWLLCREYEVPAHAARLAGLTDVGLQQKIKKQLPAITVLGVFSRREASCLQEYSGFVCVDVDGADNPHIKDWGSIKAKLGAALPSLYYAGLSVGGNGVYLIFRVLTPERYLEHLNSLFSELQALGIQPDTKCTDPARLRFASFDDSPYTNFEATPYTNYWISPKEEHKKNQKTLFWFERAAFVSMLVEEIERRFVDITDGYEAWFAIGCSLASSMGEDGRSFFHRVSRFHLKYDRRQCDQQYDGCMAFKDRYTIGTLFHYCKALYVLAEFMM
ncbi:PriCT-2 domain-containing protein [uncultured Alistipes sp.]|jgi:virE protein|uniref:PriCT-2 domain-containing protein n=1 Tax=uncultured Alistipes sp. TaxID=538949 RepID=UPI0027D98D68|nr:PriCT-2 domain-containing protein [uncultured Alistipes sp.]